jgi:hypothetical protein
MSPTVKVESAVSTVDCASASAEWTANATAASSTTRDFMF